MTRRNPNIAIRRHPLGPLDEPERIRATRRGEIVHYALDALGALGRGQRPRPSGADLERAIERAVERAFAVLDLDQAGWKMHDDFVGPIARAFELARFSDWFDPAARSLREAEIRDAEGKVLRPDRVVMREDRVEVVDFKAGKREDAHGDQVRTYVELLKAIFAGKSVAGFLVYIDEPAIVEVT